MLGIKTENKRLFHYKQIHRRVLSLKDFCEN